MSTTTSVQTAGKARVAKMEAGAFLFLGREGCRTGILGLYNPATYVQQFYAVVPNILLLPIS